MEKCRTCCCAVSEFFRHAMCIASRRGSIESYYRELGDQDTLKIEDKSSNIVSDDSENTNHEVDNRPYSMDLEMSTLRRLGGCTGRFLTLHKRRRKTLATRSLKEDSALVDDLNNCLVNCILKQSGQWNFNAFILENVSGGCSLSVLCVYLFHSYGVITHFDLDVTKVWKLFSLIEDGYHSLNPYHNSVHAADVTQAMHCFLQQKQILENMPPLEIMASLLAASAHDMDHPGVNQHFLIATSNHLADLFQKTSVLENHHWRFAISCLFESRLLEHRPELQQELKTQVKSLIMATDITRQQDYLGLFKVYLDTNTLDLSIYEHRQLVLQIALKCADISNPCRTWDISRKWSLKVCEEFFCQGDIERKLQLPVSPLCDRDNTSIPRIQTGFFKFVVTPLITEWHRFLQTDLTAQMLENLICNQGKWDALLDQEMADETGTEISDADMVDDDIETDTSDSSDPLLPDRRISLNPTAPAAIREQLRRFSAPLTLFQDIRNRSRDNTESASAVSSLNQSLTGSVDSINSELSSDGQCEARTDQIFISTENLRPDSTIASITTPVQATRLNTVLREGGKFKLIRQQTFPPLETALSHSLAARPLHSSNEDTTGGGNRFVSLFKRNDTDQGNASVKSNVDITQSMRNSDEMDDGQVAAGGRRDSGAVGSQLLENLVAAQSEMGAEELLQPRRKSMPVVTVADAPKDKSITSSLPQFLLRTLSGKECWTRRRGSAPCPVASSELRGLASPTSRHSVNGGRRKLNPLEVCQQWLAKAAQSVHDKSSKSLTRRSSLPAEILQTSLPK